MMKSHALFSLAIFFKYLSRFRKIIIFQTLFDFFINEKVTKQILLLHHSSFFFLISSYLANHLGAIRLKITGLNVSFWTMT
jgi:hypothetical protein